MIDQPLTVLLFGATGTIGGYAAAALAGRPNVRVRAAVRPVSHANLGRLENLGVEIVRADLGDPDSLEAAFEGVDHAFIVNSLFSLDDMAEHTANFLEAAKRAGVRRIVRSGVAPFPPCEMGDLHLAAQKMFEESGIPYVFVRPNYFNTNLCWWAGTIKEKSSIYLPLGDGRIAWTDPQDIGEVVAHALTADDVEGRTFHVTGPEAIDTATVARHLGDAIRAAKRDRNELMQKGFDRLDSNGDGFITRNELEEHLATFGFSGGEISGFLRSADTDGDGQISIDEYRDDVKRAADARLDSAETNIAYIAVDDDTAAREMTMLGVPPRAIELLTGLYALLRTGGAEPLGNGVQDALGRPATSMREWADRHVATFIPTHWETLQASDLELRPSSVG
jgi:uncharacterized protein YbjT (DUF2867 family)